MPSFVCEGSGHERSNFQFASQNLCLSFAVSDGNSNGDGKCNQFRDFEDCQKKKWSKFSCHSEAKRSFLTPFLVKPSSAPVEFRQCSTDETRGVLPI